MAVIGADGLSLLVGDGAGPEIFNTLRGSAVTRLEVTQKLNPGNAIRSDAWQVQTGVSERRITLECEGYATDEASALRIRSHALSGTLGNFKLKTRGSEMLAFSAAVSSYREVGVAGDIKRFISRLESSGGASLA